MQRLMQLSDIDYQLPDRLIAQTKFNLALTQIAARQRECEEK